MGMWCRLCRALPFKDLLGYRGEKLYYGGAFITLLLVLLVWGLTSDIHFSAVWISVGLMGSIVIEGLLSSKRFMKLCYLIFLLVCITFSLAFWTRVSDPVHWDAVIFLVAGGIVLFLLMLPHIDKQLIPAIVLGAVLLELIWAASEWWLQERNWVSGIGLAGTLLLFIISFQILTALAKKTFTSVGPLSLGGFLLSLLCIASTVL
jgi:uncharacterized membrane protein YhhN